MASNLELLLPLLTAFPTGDSRLTPDSQEAIDRLETALARIAAPELECAMVGPDPSFRADYRGVEGVIEAWRDWLSPYESFRMELEDSIEEGEHVVTLVRQFGTPVGGGPEIGNAGAAVWTFRDGMLRRVEFHLDRAVALKAAGLDPQSGQE